MLIPPLNYQHVLETIATITDHFVLKIKSMNRKSSFTFSKNIATFILFINSLPWKTKIPVKGNYKFLNLSKNKIILEKK